MSKPVPNHQPGPGRSTQKDAFEDVARSVAARNELAHKEARKVRAAREQAQQALKRRLDLI
jgi:hypothetical protein